MTKHPLLLMLLSFAQTGCASERFYVKVIDGEGAPIAIKTDDNAKAEAILNAAGVTTLGMEDLQ